MEIAIQQSPLIRGRTVIGGLSVLIGLYLTSLYHYTLFHSLAEIFGIIVAYGVFMVAYNSRKFLDNNYLLYLGISYFFIGFIDLLHTFGYQGMGMFQEYGTNLSAQLWIIARYMESISYVVAALFLKKKLNIKLIFLIYLVITSFLLITVFLWQVFPVCFVEGQGLTLFKKASEYIIAIILISAIIVLCSNRNDLDKRVFRLIAASISATIISELCFTLYIHAYGLPNLIGHYFKIISFFLIYKAIIETGLEMPYTLLFRNLKKSEEDLKRNQEELEKRIEERTADLRRISMRLLNAQEEERRLVALELHDDLGQSLSAIKFRVEKVLLDSRGKVSQDCIDSLESVVPMIQGAIEGIRRMQKNLRPSSLDDLGILPTISWFCREFKETYSNIRIDTEFEIEEKDVPEPLKINIFRVIQEAFNNVAKHSNAHFVKLSLKRSEDRLIMVIQDDGSGFNPDDVNRSESRPAGLGLSSMKERTLLFGGNFSIDSRKGSGTKVMASWGIRDPRLPWMY